MQQYICNAAIASCVKKGEKLLMLLSSRGLSAYVYPRKVVEAKLHRSTNEKQPLRGAIASAAARHLMKAAGNAIDAEHYRQVANAKDIDRKTYDARQHQDYLKPEEARVRKIPYS
ncbi:hypothetical protein NIES2111_57370 (plasmid) [Nostoc sp. NIES-2111]|nr:hypothetical protein NIES2111_57370 [Nostoc sp. NIES-2111]